MYGHLAVVQIRHINQQGEFRVNGKAIGMFDPGAFIDKTVVFPCHGFYGFQGDQCDAIVLISPMRQAGAYHFTHLETLIRWGSFSSIRSRPRESWVRSISISSSSALPRM